MTEETIKAPVKRWAHIENMIMYLGDNIDIKQGFVFEWNGEYQLEVSNVGGVLKVTNGVDGWGNNCRDKFKDTHVQILVDEERYKALHELKREDMAALAKQIVEHKAALSGTEANNWKEMWRTAVSKNKQYIDLYHKEHAERIAWQQEAQALKEVKLAGSERVECYLPCEFKEAGTLAKPENGEVGFWLKKVTLTVVPNHQS